MARPVKSGLDYFPHDTDAANDEKIEALRALYGNDGYAFYFILLERIYRTENGELDISSQQTLEVLRKKIGISKKKFENLLKFTFSLHCFDEIAYNEKKVLTSNGIKRRFLEVKGMREKWRKKKRKLSSEIFPEENPEETPKENPEETGESKEKKSKVNKSTIYKNKYAEFVSMTEEEYQKLIDKYGEPMTKRMIEVLNNYKGSKGKKYKSDYLAILNWVVDRVKKEQQQQPNRVTSIDYDKASESKYGW